MSRFENINTVLIANRGEIALRLIKCCKENGLKTVAIFTNDESNSPHVIEADVTYMLLESGAAGYINIQEIVQVAIDYKVDVVIPGYGFLSENSSFAEALKKHNIAFAGPSSESIQLFGLKHNARSLALENKVPIVPGTELIETYELAALAAKDVGYPVMLKSTAGGGGMGLKVCFSEEDLNDAYNVVISRGKTLFNNCGIFLEKYVEQARHIEIQIFGNGKGDVIAFGERECSIQRRHQKVIEESPSPFIQMSKYNRSNLRKKLSNCATQLASSIKYKSAGTVEFLVNDLNGEFYFLEMNTRLQVEHGLTELVYGIDLVRLMLLQADYELRNEEGVPWEVLSTEGSYEKDLNGVCIPLGHAIECRVYAENPAKEFLPSPGVLHYVQFPESSGNYRIRTDHWISTGTKVSPYFDPLLAKIMVWAPTREESIKGMYEVLSNTKIQGPPVNIDYLSRIVMSPDFIAGNTLTSFLTSQFSYRPNMIEFIRSGTLTTIQDLPGRERSNGGVPLSGPTDSLCFRLANLLVGNGETVEAIEISYKGPKIKFYSSAIVCLAGSDFKFEVNGRDLPLFTAINIPAGSTLRIGNTLGRGTKSYLAIRGGFPDVAFYLGSKSCTPTLGLGGHQGNVILPGSYLTVKDQGKIDKVELGPMLPYYSIPDLITAKEDGFNIRMLSGPHDTADICSKDGLEMFYNTVYKVNLNSNRGCTKLDGPADVFSRLDGADGGSHPSNILEYPYPTCGLSVVGSVMSLFGVDGATLSGFACISVPIKVDWWKFGQAKIGEGIKFKLVSYADALKLEDQRKMFFADIKKAIELNSNYPVFSDELEEYESTEKSLNNTVLYEREAFGDSPSFTIRQAGEKMILFDYGVETFSLLKYGRQKALENSITNYDSNSKFAKSLLRVESNTGATAILFDTQSISREEILQVVCELEINLPNTKELKVRSTMYKLPCCFDHSSIRYCNERYMHSQRPYAPYLPDSTSYIIKANCLKLINDLKASIIGQKQVVTAVSFLCANTLSVNLDPLTRLKSGKFNPARTFTPKGAIGAGSVGNSIYSIDSPGGYVIWGMTLPDLCWNTFSTLSTFRDNKPWFFNSFDQIQYYEVTEDELNDLNNKLLLGDLKIESEEVEFDFKSYSGFLETINDELNELNAKKRMATQKLIEEEAESMAKWQDEIELSKMKNKLNAESSLDDPNALKVLSSINANVFKINVRVGEKISNEDTLIILEAMKMEIMVKSTGDDDDDDDDTEHERDQASKFHFQVVQIMVSEGDVVSPGDVLALIKTV